jgi:VCBS repeat protein/aldos-2-ulose dehydratase/isomerase family protein
MRLLLILVLLPVPSLTFAADFPRFKTQEIDSGLKIGYAVLTTDINGDGKPDIVVVDQHKVVWYENPTWKKRIILDGKTRPDNVCACAVDIDGDGLPELVLGSAWKPSDTVNPAQLSWLKRGKSLDDEWTMHELPCDEPTVHRVRAFDIDGDGKPEIVHVPLHGKGATPKGNYMDGRPVRVIALKIPAKEPEKKENWKVRVLSEELHVCHNFHVFKARPGLPVVIDIVSYEGVSMIASVNEEWVTTRMHEGNQANPKGSRGASEIKHGFVAKETPCIATIEPWHGNQVVTYTFVGGKEGWNRHVIDDHLRWGHAVWFANLDGEPGDELVIGVRDDPNPKAGDKFTERRGVRIYKCTDGKGAKWERMLLDEGGVAVEDLCAADLNGDGRIDIIAVGRQTGNCRIYWNQGK